MDVDTSLDQSAIVAFCVYLFAVNIVCFGLFAWDKQSAQLGRRRTPERTLLTLAFIGGTVGAVVAQRTLRHKTMKEPFRTRLAMITVSQIVICSAAVGLALWKVIRDVMLTWQ